MARKLNIPKAKKIQGIRKALANRKTPRQFIPSLKKRLRKLTGAALFLLAFFAFPARAQTPVIVQPTQQTLAPAGTACTGSAQTFPVNNRNQSIHYVSIIPAGLAESIYVEIDGIDLAGNSYRISDLDAVTLASGFGFNGFTLTGYGYYPTVQVSVTCATAAGTFTLTYSGSSSSSVNVVGSYQSAQLVKEIFNGASIAGSGGVTSPNIQTPFGNSLGLINAEVTNVGGTVGIGIGCVSPILNAAQTIYDFFIPADGLSHSLPVPASNCPIMQVTVAQKATATAILEYVFMQQGFQQTPGPGVSYAHFAATTANSIKASSGTVYSITVNTPAAGTITLFDLATAACTATPSTNVVAVITVTSTIPVGAVNYDDVFLNGICVKASSASIDYTVNYQ